MYHNALLFIRMSEFSLLKRFTVVTLEASSRAREEGDILYPSPSRRGIITAYFEIPDQRIIVPNTNIIMSMKI